MTIDWWTLALQAVNVLILVWLLARFLYRPVTAAITARQAAAAKILADAEADRAAAAADAARRREALGALDGEAAARRVALSGEIEAERRRLIAAAEAEAAAVAAGAEAAAAAERSRMRLELERQAAALAGTMATKLVARLPPRVVTQALVDGLLAALREMPEERLRRLAADAPLTLATAVPLDADAEAACRAAIDAVLPATAVAFAVDPALLAGCELRGLHQRVGNSFRGDLDAMLAALREDGDGGR